MTDALTFDVRADLDAVNRALAGYRNGARTVLRRSLNRTLTPVRATAAREVAADLKLRVGTVRKSLAMRRATNAVLRALVEASGRRIPLIEFRARQTRRGVTYDLGRGRGLAEHAFVAVMRSGHRGVFRRVGKSRLPIVELRGPSIPRVFLQQKIIAALRGQAGRTWATEVQRQLRYFLAQQEAPGGD